MITAIGTGFFNVGAIIGFLIYFVSYYGFIQVVIATNKKDKIEGLFKDTGLMKEGLMNDFFVNSLVVYFDMDDIVQHHSCSLINKLIK